MGRDKLDMTNLIKGKVVDEKTISSQNECKESVGYQSRGRGITRLPEKLTRIQMRDLDTVVDPYL